MKKFLLLVMLLPAAYMASAQKAPADSVSRHPQTVSVLVGTQGVGAEYRFGLFKQLHLRFGGAILPIDKKDVFKIDDVHSNNDLTAKFTNIHLLADIIPFKNAQGFRLVVGAADILKGNGHVSVQPTDTYTYGSIVLTPDQVGKLDMDLNWKGVCPYFGLGLGRGIPKKGFGVNVDLGTYYLNTPTAAFTGTGIFAGNSSQSNQLQNNVKDYRWFPVVQLNLTFKL